MRIWTLDVYNFAHCNVNAIIHLITTDTSIWTSLLIQFLILFESDSKPKKHVTWTLVSIRLKQAPLKICQRRCQSEHKTILTLILMLEKKWNFLQCECNFLVSCDRIIKKQILNSNHEIFERTNVDIKTEDTININANAYNMFRQKKRTLLLMSTRQPWSISLCNLSRLLFLQLGPVGILFMQFTEPLKQFPG